MKRQFLSILSGIFFFPLILLSQSQNIIPASAEASVLTRMLNSSVNQDMVNLRSDSVKRTEIQNLRQRLKIDEQKALQVEKIQSDYKSALYKLEEDKSMPAEQKRRLFEKLVVEKNLKLEQLLDTAQQRQIIPLTERVLRPQVMQLRDSLQRTGK